MSNERLEFLGDSVLGLVVSDELVRRHPERSEGWLSRARSDLVRSGTLYAVAQELGLGEHLRLGKGEELTGGRSKPSILADAVEALIGAVYLDGGIDAARAVIMGRFGARIDNKGVEVGPDDPPAPTDFKSRLQEHFAKGGGVVPTYLCSESGPEHEKTFVAEVILDGAVLAEGSGHSKKRAEQAAAAVALAIVERLETIVPDSNRPDLTQPDLTQPDRNQKVANG